MCYRMMIRATKPKVQDEHHAVTVAYVVRAIHQVCGKWQNYCSHPHWQSPNIAHAITSTISTHMQHLVKIATRVGPYSQSYHSFLSPVSTLTRDI